MALVEENNLGHLIVSDEIFNTYVLDILNRFEVRGKVWLSDDESKLIEPKLSLSTKDLSDSIKIEKTEDKKIHMSIYMIIKFGTSINSVADFVSRNIFDLFKGGKFPVAQINFHVVGTMSKKVIKRDILVVRSLR